MLLVKNAGDGKAHMNTEEHAAFVKACEVYIGKLQAKKQLLAAKPLLREGVIIRKQSGNWAEEKIDLQGTVQVGYYHIIANNLEEAIEIAKENPEFNYVPGASVEVRPLKSSETSTGFKYPGQEKS